VIFHRFDPPIRTGGGNRPAAWSRSRALTERDSNFDKE
jgi:hypothetical protein